MAKKNTPKETKETANTNESHAKRIRILQESVDDVCDRIEGTGRSFTARAIRSRSVAPNVVEAAFAAIEQALSDGREAYAAAQDTDDTARVARVDLSRL